MFLQLAVGMKSERKILGSVCLKHSELNGLRYALLRKGRYTPSNCVSCHAEYRNSIAGKASLEKWRRANPERARADADQFRKKHPEKVREWSKKYRIENAETIALKKKEYARSNRDSISAARKEKYAAIDIDIRKKRSRLQYIKRDKRLEAARSLAWAKAHPEKMAAQDAIRRASKLRAVPKWANKFFMKEICHLAQLRTKMFGYKWHVDHIVPLRSKIVCGLHVENNLQVIPAAHNWSKGNRVWADMP